MFGRGLIRVGDGQVYCPVLGPCYELESLYRHILWEHKDGGAGCVEQAQGRT